MDAAAPSPSGIWKDAKGNDVFSKTSAPFYIFQILLVLYILGYLGHLVLVQNATVVHTYNYQNNPGVLYSERYNSFYWFALMFSTMRLFLFVSVCSLILYRKTQCCCGPPGNRGCSLFWTFMVGMFLTFDVIVLAILGSFFNGCNMPGNANNPCNDLRYCHVPEVYKNMDSGCTYQTPWMPSIVLSQLGYNADFLWFFATTVVFVTVDLVFLLFPVALWLEAYDPKLRFKLKIRDQEAPKQALPTFDIYSIEAELAEKTAIRQRKKVDIAPTGFKRSKKHLLPPVEAQKFDKKE